MKIHSIIILIFIISLVYACEDTIPILNHAKGYEVVYEMDMNLKTKMRTAKMFSIVSDAQTFDELAQTGILAAYELHKKHSYDLTSILLYPNKNLIRTGAYYVQVEFAADNKGALGLNGVDQTLYTSGKWKVRSAEKALSGLELSILNLWYENQHKFPSKDPLSSLRFDKGSLIEYIANELKIDIAEVKRPHIKYKDYKGVNLKSWMTPEPY